MVEKLLLYFQSESLANQIKDYLNTTYMVHELQYHVHKLIMTGS
ncbi:unnamed protein product [Trifolium pratense]|uniref:Uncharacterized protein n=1 Tax=Trifolium pratense TaxID=57577 RepID=A0ACB0IPZ6_TRIPR|nr:unnamed protein product [Trifolium pratense]